MHPTSAATPTLFHVAAGIFDASASEYLSANLASAAAVGQYAYGALDIALSSAEEKLVFACCKKWLALEYKSADQFYWVVEEPLSAEIGA
jgi:hypothetical protein